MSHVLTTILDNLQTAISGNGVTVERSRAYPQDERNLPRYMVWPERQEVDYDNSTLAGLMRLLTVRVEAVVQASAPETTLMEHLAYLENQLADVELDDTVRCQLQNTEFQWNVEGQTPIAIASLTFLILYRTLSTDASAST